jgi:hypothetical protein
MQRLTSLRTHPFLPPVSPKKIPQSGSLKVQWVPGHVLWGASADYVNNINYPLQPRVADKFEKKKSDQPLWWSCQTYIKVGGRKASVRNWFTNRARQAIRLALTSNGYDNFGRRLDKSDRKEDLYGTAHFAVTDQMISTKWEQLVKEANGIIAGLVEMAADKKPDQQKKPRAAAPGARPKQQTAGSPTGKGKPNPQRKPANPGGAKHDRNFQPRTQD